MDTVNLEDPATTFTSIGRQPRVWGFWTTALWGLFIFAAMVVGQFAIVGYLAWQQDGPFDAGKLVQDVQSGAVLPLSVITGLPLVLAASWLAIRFTRISFTEYLALRGTSWKNLLIGVVGLVVVVLGWEMISFVTGRESTPGFMTDVFKSARDAGALWLLVLAFCVAAPVSEEVFARGFLYRGWSESFLRVPGAIFLSTLVWTAMHLQYNWYFFGEVFCIGLWLGYVRYRSGSLWVAILIHGLNNLAAVVQSYYLTN